MDESSARMQNNGGMCVVLLASKEEISEEIALLNLAEALYIVNENAPNQIVLAGTMVAIDLFTASFTQKVRCKVQLLPVAGPWHTPFMEYGRAEFERWVANRTLLVPHTPFIMNSCATAVTDPEEIRARITGQLVKPVYWRDTLLYAAQKGFQQTLEVGPGKILTGTIRANKVKDILTSSFSVSTPQEVRVYLSTQEESLCLQD